MRFTRSTSPLTFNYQLNKSSLIHCSSTSLSWCITGQEIIMVTTYRVHNLKNQLLQIDPPTIVRVRKLKNRYLQIDLQTIVMCKGRSNQQSTRVAANFVHFF